MRISVLLLAYFFAILAYFFAISIEPVKVRSGNNPVVQNFPKPERKSEPLSPQQFAQLQEVTEIAISPNGKDIAYILRVPRKLPQEKNGSAWQELHVITVDGKSRSYLRGQFRASKISWTPDGRGISFLAKKPGKNRRKSLYLMPVNGGEAKRILTHKTDIKEYAWSPSGKQVAFLATEKLAKKQQKLKKLGFNQQIFREDWRSVEVWLSNLEKDSKPQVLELPGSASELHWGPMGTKLAVALAPTSLVDDSYTSRKVTIVDLKSRRIIQQINNVGKLGQIVWSPDGTRLGIIGSVNERDPKAGRIQVAKANQSRLEDVLPDYLGHVRKIDWLDRENIIYLGDEGVKTVLGQISISGRTSILSIDRGTPVTADTLVSRRCNGDSEEFILRDFSISKDRKSIASICSSPTHPREVCYWNSKNRKIVRLTNSNPWLDRIVLGSQEVLQYQARDGLELEGLLIRPVGYQQGKRYPLIIVAHGGPESHYRNEWLTAYDRPGQMAATRGYAVFYPNYRGSTGRGVKFSQLGQGDPAGKEFDDLVDGVDFLIKIGLADPNKVGITGKSYGGYAAAWGATYYSDKFAAAVTSFGIANNISKVGTTDIPEEEYLVHALRRPWSDWQFFLERSPIYHAGKSKTPTLILHGELDPRLRASQSLELYTHLKQRSQSAVRLIIYPNEKHGNIRAASRLDYSLRMMRWFDYYLQGSGESIPDFEIEYGLESDRAEKK